MVSISHNSFIVFVMFVDWRGVAATITGNLWEEVKLLPSPIFFCAVCCFGLM